MILEELSRRQLDELLRGPGVRLRIGPFMVRILYRDRSPFAETLRFHYGLFPLLNDNQPAEFRINLVRPVNLRRWLGRQIVFKLDDFEPFYPFPSRLAFPLFEWGLNWCIYEHVHEHIVLHAAVVERDGSALLMPAASGSGKSTLCAALVHRGWRLLSDEFALLSKTDGMVYPIPRPIGLKQVSIQLIQERAPELSLGPAFIETHKGTVAHLRPPADAVRRMTEPAKPAWVVFPKFDANCCGGLVPASKASAFIAASDSCFNYKSLGEVSFDQLARLVGQCDAYDLPFAELEAAAAELDGLSAARRDGV